MAKVSFKIVLDVTVNGQDRKLDFIQLESLRKKIEKLPVTAPMTLEALDYHQGAIVQAKIVKVFQVS